METVFGRILMRRGLEAAIPELAIGEPYFAEDTKQLWMGTTEGNEKVVGSGEAEEKIDEHLTDPTAAHNASAIAFSGSTTFSANNVQQAIADLDFWKPTTAPTMAYAKGLHLPALVPYLYLAGFYSAGDGGAALYRRVTVPPPHAGKVQTADGSWWEIAEVRIDIKQFGARGDGALYPVGNWITLGLFADLAAIQAVYPFVVGVNDSVDGVAFQAAANMLLGIPFAGGDLYLPVGTYVLNQQVRLLKTSGKLLKVRGTGRGTILDVSAMTAVAGVYSGSTSAAEYASADFFDLTFRGNSQTTGRALALENANGARLERVNFLQVFMAIVISDCFSIHLVGCLWVNVGGYAIYSTTACHNMTLSDGCAMFDVGVQAAGRCIAITAPTDNVSITDSDFESCRQILQMNGGTALTFERNYVEYCTVDAFDFYAPLWSSSITNNWISLGASFAFRNLQDTEVKRLSVYNQAITFDASCARVESKQHRPWGTGSIGLPPFTGCVTTPAPSASSGAFTTATCTLHFWVEGRLFTYCATVTITNAGTAAGALNIPLPFAPAINSAGCGREIQATGSALSVQTMAATPAVVIFKYDNTTIIASGRTVVVSGNFFI